ncbi:REP-associated tyrosine transposase [Marinobacterium arenosum]|uniref:REP-associated tyrosine transposase n=1 Tax=Marinobacterium arenosum TaxID=2862496 RepID=UPI001C985C43|nr:transposase [Marinobacterium arenosum]MBY4677317.1 transposase [Marinobacterium arenosum]
MTRTVRAGSKRLRYGRYSEPYRIYLITATTENRAPWFQEFNIGRLLVDCFRGTESNTKTLAFVVMPDHFHWLMQLGDHVSLSKVVQQVKSVSAHRINKHLKRHGPIWQDGFHDRALRREEDLQAIARYIVMNPIRAELVNSVRKYPLWDAIWL